MALSPYQVASSPLTASDANPYIVRVDMPLEGENSSWLSNLQSKVKRAGHQALHQLHKAAVHVTRDPEDYIYLLRSQLKETLHQQQKMEEIVETAYTTQDSYDAHKKKLEELQDQMSEALERETKRAKEGKYFTNPLRMKDATYKNKQRLNRLEVLEHKFKDHLSRKVPEINIRKLLKMLAESLHTVREKEESEGLMTPEEAEDMEIGENHENENRTMHETLEAQEERNSSPRSSPEEAGDLGLENAMLKEEIRNEKARTAELEQELSNADKSRKVIHSSPEPDINP